MIVDPPGQDSSNQTSALANSPVANTSTHIQALSPIPTSIQPPQQLELISQMFREYVDSNTNCTIPSDFLALAITGMEHLKSANRSNVIYELAKGLGTMRPDESDSLFPTKRMPMGLIEYNINFFTSSAINQVSSELFHYIARAKDCMYGRLACIMSIGSMPIRLSDMVTVYVYLIWH